MAGDSGEASAHDVQLTTDAARPKPEVSTESPTPELLGGFLSILFGVFRVVKSVFPTNADIIWQGRTQHDVLRSDVENILVPWFGHSPEQATVAGAGLDDEAVDFMRHGFSCA
jgi:hypothetical protein